MIPLKTHEILKKLRIDYGYTQQNLADLLKIDRSAYTYYESGKTNPSIDKLIRLANLYGVTVDKLLGNEIEAPSQTVILSTADPFEEDRTKNEKFQHLTRDEQQLVMSFRAFTNKQRFLELLEQHLIENETEDDEQF